VASARAIRRVKSNANVDAPQQLATNIAGGKRNADLAGTVESGTVECIGDDGRNADFAGTVKSGTVASIGEGSASGTVAEGSGTASMESLAEPIQL
jgi:hypothetical protein